MLTVRRLIDWEVGQVRAESSTAAATRQAHDAAALPAALRGFWLATGGSGWVWSAINDEPEVLGRPWK